MCKSNIVPLEQKTEVQKLDDIETLAAPLIEYIQKHYDKHVRIELTTEGVRVDRMITSAPADPTGLRHIVEWPEGWDLGLDAIEWE